MPALSSAAPLDFTREYRYQASEADSKLSSRAIALEQIKRLLLEELGTYLVSMTEVKAAQLTKDEIITYTAGAVVTVIIEERWNGVEYYIKAKMTADPVDVANAVKSVKDDDSAMRELAGLKEQTSSALKEIERLRKELDDAKKALTAAHEKQAAEKAAALTEPTEAKKAETALNEKTAIDKSAAIQKAYDGEVKKLEAAELMNEAHRLRKQRKFKDSNVLLDKAIALTPNWAPPYLGKAANFNFLEKPGEALRYVEKAAVLEPENPRIMTARGVALIRMNKRQEGLAAIERALRTNPDDDQIMTEMGWALIELNRHREAIRYLTKAIELKPQESGRRFFLRAQAFRHLGDHDRFIDDIEAAARQGNPKAAAILDDIRSGRKPRRR